MKALRGSIPSIRARHRIFGSSSADAPARRETERASHRGTIGTRTRKGYIPSGCFFIPLPPSRSARTSKKEKAPVNVRSGACGGGGTLQPVCLVYPGCEPVCLSSDTAGPFRLGTRILQRLVGFPPMGMRTSFRSKTDCLYDTDPRGWPLRRKPLLRSRRSAALVRSLGDMVIDGQFARNPTIVIIPCHITELPFP